mgnify:FL=1
MNTDFQKILERIAKQHNTTPKEVYQEMQYAIDIAFDNPNPEVIKNWKSITFQGDRPTPEDVVYGLGLMLAPGNGTTH